VAFTYDITTDRGRVRLNLADTDPSAYTFEDAEVDALLSSEGTVSGATLALLRVLLADRARRVKRFSMQGLSLDDTAQIAAIRALISQYGGDTATVQAVMPSLLPSDEGWTEITVS
jgi:hypothetical protein